MEAIGLVIGQLLLIGMAMLVGAILCFLTSRIILGKSSKKRAFLIVAFLFPVLTLVYFDGVLVSIAIVRHLSGEEKFLSGFSHYPLIGGYELVDWDEDPTQDYIGKSNSSPSPLEQEIVGHVKEVQVSSPLILVTTHSNSFREGEKDLDGYVILDSQSGHIQRFSSLNELERSAEDKGN